MSTFARGLPVSLCLTWIWPQFATTGTARELASVGPRLGLAGSLDLDQHVAAVQLLGQLARERRLLRRQLHRLRQVGPDVRELAGILLDGGIPAEQKKWGRVSFGPFRVGWAPFTIASSIAPAAGNRPRPSAERRGRTGRIQLQDGLPNRTVRGRVRSVVSRVRRRKLPLQSSCSRQNQSRLTKSAKKPLRSGNGTQQPPSSPAYRASRWPCRPPSAGLALPGVNCGVSAAAAG